MFVPYPMCVCVFGIVVVVPRSRTGFVLFVPYPMCVCVFGIVVVVPRSRTGFVLSVAATQSEDLADETFILRHKRCELEERKRLFNFVQYPPTRRHRGPHHGSQDSATCPGTPNLPVSMGTQASLDGGDFGDGRGEGGEEEDSSMDAPPPPPLPVHRFSASLLPPTPPGTALPHFSLGPAGDDEASLPGLNATTNSGFGGSSSGGGGGGGSCSVPGFVVQGFSIPRRGSTPGLPHQPPRERLSLGSSLEDWDWDVCTGLGPRTFSVQQPWPARHFPLSEEGVAQLAAEEAAAEAPCRDLKAPSSSYVLRAVEGGGAGGSQAGSSVSGGSLPASPMPSSCSGSASASGDYDAADPEWVAEAETSKRLASTSKAIKR